jgi:hypothetical protein
MVAKDHLKPQTLLLMMKNDLDNDHIEVLGYKKSKKSEKNIKTMESLEES